MTSANDKYSRRKVDPDEAIKAQAERSIDESAYTARRESLRKDSGTPKWSTDPSHEIDRIARNDRQDSNDKEWFNRAKRKK